MCFWQKRSLLRVFPTTTTLNYGSPRRGSPRSSGRAPLISVLCVSPVAWSLSSPACSWIRTPVQVNLCQCLQSTRATRNDKQQYFQPHISDSLEQAQFQRAGFCSYFSQACLPISTCRVKHGRRGLLLRKPSSYKTKGIPFNYSQQAD